LKVYAVFLSPLKVMKWDSFLNITAYRKSKANGDYEQKNLTQIIDTDG